MAAILAVTAMIAGWLLGLAMAADWGIGDSPRVPGVYFVAQWMAATSPVEYAGRFYFLTILLLLPTVWTVCGAVSRRLRWMTAGAFGVASAAIALEYNTPERYGWVVDLVALLIALIATVAVGIVGLRRAAVPRSVAWSLVAALPLTPLGALLVLGYMPPGLAMGLLIAWAGAAIFRAKGSSSVA
jgi:hypothetical protein